MQAMIRQPPEKYGQPQTRWTLRTMLICCPWLRLTTEPGLSQLLHRLGIHWKRAQDHIHSPDAAYFDKLRYIDQQLQLARDDPEHYAFLFLDEITVYRQPTLAFAYERAGHRQPLAHQSCRSNTAHRILGAVDALTGQVFYMHRSHITVSVLTQFFEKVAASMRAGKSSSRSTTGRSTFIGTSWLLWSPRSGHGRRQSHPIGRPRLGRKPSARICRFSCSVCQLTLPGPIQWKRSGGA